MKLIIRPMTKDKTAFVVCDRSEPVAMIFDKGEGRFNWALTNDEEEPIHYGGASSKKEALEKIGLKLAELSAEGSEG